MSKPKIFECDCSYAVGPNFIWTNHGPFGGKLEIYADEIILSYPFVKRAYPKENILSISESLLGFKINHNIPDYPKYVTFGNFGKSQKIWNILREQGYKLQ